MLFSLTFFLLYVSIYDISLYGLLHVSWEDQGRQDHGHFGSGTSSGGGESVTSDRDAAFAARTAAAAHTVVAHVAPADRRHPAVTFDGPAMEDLQRTISAWNKASGLSLDAFRDRFLDPGTGDRTAIVLRDAARTIADSHTELHESGAALTEAMQAVGLDRWSRFLHDAAARVDGDTGGGTTYVATDPLQWTKRPSVGNGQCVALVQMATHMPNTAHWRAGVLVQGNLGLPAGTIIALFDPNGHYGNHEDGRSHAAIYMGQDSRGIHVIDQWIERRDGTVIRIQNPHERTIEFQKKGRLPVDRGEDYRVVQ